jgi:hypothetical protein
VGLAIFGIRLGQACAQLTHAWVKFCQVAQRRFLTAPSVCRHPNCPLTRRTKQRMGRIVHGSDCTWVRLSQPTFRPTSKDCLNMKMFVVRVGVSQCLNGGWHNRQGTAPLLHGAEWKLRVSQFHLEVMPSTQAEPVPPRAKCQGQEASC